MDEVAKAEEVVRPVEEVAMEDAEGLGVVVRAAANMVRAKVAAGKAGEELVAEG